MILHILRLIFALYILSSTTIVAFAEDNGETNLDRIIGSATIDIAGILAAITWPLVILFVLYWYREPISGLVSSLPDRLHKVAFAGVSIELARVPEMSSRTPDIDVMEVRGGHIQINDTLAETFATQLEDPERSDFALIDLGSGQEWLSSRLYIMSVLLPRMRGLQAFVFVATQGQTEHRYLGWADPSAVRWALAKRFDWLEPAFAAAYAAFRQSSVDTPIFESQIEIINLEGKLRWRDKTWTGSPSISLLKEFLNNVQPPTPPMDKDWQTLQPKPLLGQVPPAAIIERGIWLDGDLLAGTLGEVLHGNCISDDGFDTRPNDERARLILLEKASYVAVTTSDMRFRYLLDRQQLADIAVDLSFK